MDLSSRFLAQYFRLTDVMSQADFIGKDNNPIRCTLNSSQAKKDIMLNKRTALSNLVYVDHNRTPHDSNIAREIRVEARRLRDSDKKTKQGQWSIQIDGAWHQWDNYKHSQLAQMQTHSTHRKNSDWPASTAPWVCNLNSQSKYTSSTSPPTPQVHQLHKSTRSMKAQHRL